MEIAARLQVIGLGRHRGIADDLPNRV